MKVPLLFLFFLSVLMWSCSSSDHFFHDAKVYEQNNMPLEAIKNYERSYRQNNNVEAHVALRNLSVRYSEGELAQAKIALQSNRFEEAERKLIQLERFQREYQWLNLDLSSKINQTSNELNAAWSESLYEQAYQSVLSERYDDADIFIHQLEKKSPNYPELDYLKSLRIIIPNYNKAEKAFELELYREAMNFYAEVLSVDADYKNAMERFNECLNKVRFSLSIVLKENENIPDALERSISAEIKQGIIELNDKSIQLVDRENIDDLLAEQLLGMGAGFGDNITGDAGELIGAQYIIIGEFVNYRVRSSPERRYERKGYLGPNTTDQKVNYYYYEREDHMEASFRFVMVETATGKVIAADHVPYVESQKIAYARFNGNAQRLYPGMWRTKLLGSRMDEVYTEQKPALDQLLQNNIGGGSEVGFQQQFTELVATRIADMMITFTSNR